MVSYSTIRDAIFQKTCSCALEILYLQYIIYDMEGIAISYYN